MGKVVLFVLLVLAIMAGHPPFVKGDDVDDGNALESTTIAQTKIPDFTSTDASESLLDGATSTIPDISTTEPSISTAPETSSIPDPTSTSSDNLKNVDDDTEHASTTTTSTSTPEMKENELPEGGREDEPPRMPAQPAQNANAGVISSFQDIFKKVDTLATGAIMGGFDKEKVPPPLHPPTDEDKTKLSNQIRGALKYYKDYRIVAVPGADVPDPFPVPNFSKKMGGTPFTFFNTTMYGMSNYSIQHINTNLEKMQVYIEVFMPRLVVLGNYTAKSWFKKAAGPFNVTILDVTSSGAAALTRDEDGNLLASDSEMDMQFRDGRVDFKNLGLMGSILQGMLSGAAPLLFDAIKPAVLGEINDKIRTDINNKIRTVGSKFIASNASSPLDQAIEEARSYMRTNGYDPFRIENYVLKKSVLLVNISEFTLNGVSDFYKASDIELSMDNGTLELGLHIATKKLHGRCRWLFAFGNRFARAGWSNFTVNYIQTKFYVTQSLDITEHPQLRQLDINVGKIILDVSGLGKLDIIAETLVNTLPDLLRHIIVDAIEIPIKIKAQEILDRVNVQELLDKTLPELDRIGV
ncbi:Haemolymph juvenile hormone Hypothetical protein protein (JHBP) [Nesidiocoris tenuis]|uniref:Lipid-binding serum glycoprotein C-terminal domain-containing protein n=1 Tax=Nesidiocoris tenuis TaxID=355587 RepID=A0ABN7AEN9_9HEMI|nr:Haemolymph juvenile hormone Hypothetical protein protein (JHBP) [Nesidiocoris tenuis]